MAVSRPFDPAQAVRYGSFVETAYRMYASAPADPQPAPLPLPDGYVFVAWVQMKDFVIASGDWSFYGLLAQDPGNSTRFVLAIRGTQDLTEWWDNLTSAVPAPWVGAGHVGYGFNRIYQTLRLVERDAPAADVARAPLVTPPAPGFAQQVAAATHRHAGAPAWAPAAARALAPAPTRSIDVVGHSLGGAMATLYVAENATRPGAPAGAVDTPLLCTFASPRVGDAAFAQAVNDLGLTSWRVVNELDVVPKLPPIGFAHVDQLQKYNSGRLVHWSLSCWHAMATYLHLVDPSQPLGSACSLSPAMAPMLAREPDLRTAPARDTVMPPALERVAQSEAGGRNRETIEITVRIG